MQAVRRQWQLLLIFVDNLAIQTSSTLLPTGTRLNSYLPVCLKIRYFYVYTT